MKNSPHIAARRSLAIWAMLAIALVAFSYVFTLFLAAAFVYFPFLLLASAAGINTFLIFVGGLVVSVVILWSLVPRRDKFSPPGPLLNLAQHPRLAAELTRIAHELNEPVPSEVYVVPDLNAWVAERGGMMGFGSRRVMGLGLPLLRILTVSQFRAILTHEFGHYYGGDTRLWPWVHKTRAAMARTLVNLGSGGFAETIGRINLIGIVFMVAVTALGIYWKIFMRITQAISRKHEYRADELASQLAGGQAFIDGLSAIQGASIALPLYWRTEMVPAMGAGYRPPLAEGFAQFIAVPGIAKAISNHVASQLDNGASDPYDTHPPLKKRIEAVRKHAENGHETTNTPALSLLDSVDAVEVELLRAIVQGCNVSDLRAVSWDQIGPEGYVPAWRKMVQESAPTFDAYTFQQLPHVIANLKELARAVKIPPGMLPTPEQRVEYAAQQVWRVVTVALFDAGWTLHTTPGVFYIERGGDRITPADVISQMRSGELKSVDWIERCRQYGILELPLAAPQKAAGAEG